MLLSLFLITFLYENPNSKYQKKYLAEIGQKKKFAEKRICRRQNWWEKIGQKTIVGKKMN